MSAKFEKIETITNLAYPIAGLIGFYLHNDERFLMVMVVMGVGSAVFHKFKEGNPEIFRADWFAMHVSLNTLTGILLSNSTAWIVLAIFSTIYGFFLMGRMNVYLEVALAALPTVIVLFQQKEFYQALIVLAVFGIAIYIRSKDPDKEQEEFHDSWHHGLWHILTATGFYFILYL